LIIIRRKDRNSNKRLKLRDMASSSTTNTEFENRQFQINGIECELLLMACKDRYEILMHQLECMQQRGMSATEATGELAQRYKTLIDRLKKVGASS
jgi:hypothetical protein